jgi:hypothetical protein
MHRTLLTVVVIAGYGFVLAGCATQAVGPDGPDDMAGAGAANRSSNAPPPAPPYKLTDAEMKLDCGKLTGQMKVKIAIMRSDMTRPTTSEIGRVAQQTVTPVFGGSKRGADPAADVRADRAKLEAFNARLAEKKCKTVDIDAELKGQAPPAKVPASPPPARKT